jgi:FixJ family two-component response regulator
MHLVLDVRLLGGSGAGSARPNCRRVAEFDHLITGHGDIPMSVHAMKGCAVEFLTKPFRDQVLLDAIHQTSGATAQIESVKLRLPNSAHGMIR